MISPDNRRYAYGKAQLIEVICQLRFPTILSIDTREPADFQETVREAFPRYQCQALAAAFLPRPTSSRCSTRAQRNPMWPPAYIRPSSIR